MIIQVITSEHDSQCANIDPFVVADNTLLFQVSFREAMQGFLLRTVGRAFRNG